MSFILKDLFYSPIWFGFPETAALTLDMLGTFNFNMAELTIFYREVRTVVNIAIMTALDVAGKINKDDSTTESDSTTRVSYWPAKREVNSPHADNEQRLL